MKVIQLTNDQHRLLLDILDQAQSESTGNPELDALIEKLEAEPVKQKITVPLSENDIQDLQSGESFDWQFPDQNDVWIDVALVPEDEESEEE